MNKKDILNIEEWNITSLFSITEQYRSLRLSNEANKTISEQEIALSLARVPGIEKINSLIIDYNSMMNNLHIIESLPALETLKLYGLHLRTLDGLQWFHNGKRIDIDTDTNHSRNIEKIVETHINDLYIHYANPGDLEAISRCKTIRSLSLSSCPRLPLQLWQNVPVDHLSLWGGTIDEITDTISLTNLYSIKINGCTNLRRFAGCNNNARRMILQACNRLDILTIETFQSLEYLLIMNMNIELPLSAFLSLKKIRDLSLGCKVNVDTTDLISSIPSLEKLSIKGLNKKLAIEMSNKNTSVLISNHKWAYRDGEPANIEELRG